MGPRIPMPRDFLCDHSVLSLCLPPDQTRSDGQKIYQLQGRVVRIFLFALSSFSTMWASKITSDKLVYGTFGLQCHYIRGSDAYCKSTALRQNFCGDGFEKCLATDPTGDDTFGGVGVELQRKTLRRSNFPYTNLGGACYCAHGISCKSSYWGGMASCI